MCFSGWWVLSWSCNIGRGFPVKSSDYFPVTQAEMMFLNCSMFALKSFTGDHLPIYMCCVTSQALLAFSLAGAWRNTQHMSWACYPDLLSGAVWCHSVTDKRSGDAWRLIARQHHVPPRRSSLAESALGLQDCGHWVSRGSRRQWDTFPFLLAYFVMEKPSSCHQTLSLGVNGWAGCASIAAPSLLCWHRLQG